MKVIPETFRADYKFDIYVLITVTVSTFLRVIKPKPLYLHIDSNDDDDAMIDP
jgi:hypothetical protein